MIKEYAKPITDEFNKWAKQYEDGHNNGDWHKEALAAFMCNAISSQVRKSSHKEVRDYFEANAKN